MNTYKGECIWCPKHPIVILHIIPYGAIPREAEDGNDAHCDEQLDRQDAIDLLDESTTDCLVSKGAPHGGVIVIGRGIVLNIRVVTTTGSHVLRSRTLTRNQINETRKFFRFILTLLLIANSNSSLPLNSTGTDRLWTIDESRNQFQFRVLGGIGIDFSRFWNRFTVL